MPSPADFVRDLRAQCDLDDVATSMGLNIDIDGVEDALRLDQWNVLVGLLTGNRSNTAIERVEELERISSRCVCSEERTRHLERTNAELLAACKQMLKAGVWNVDAITRTHQLAREVVTRTEVQI